MSRGKNTLVSLGMSCQTTHQLRRLVNPDSHNLSPRFTVLSGPLDWLICPPQSTIQLLDRRFPDFTRNSICLRKGRPYWQEFNLYLWHGFLADHGEQRYIDITNTFETELSRWRYLTHRFSTINPTQTVFVISNTQNNLSSEVFNESELDQYHFCHSLLEELHQSLAKFFATSTDNVHLEVITRQERMGDVENSGYGYRFPPDDNEWKGSNASWDRWWYDLLKTASNTP